MAFTTFVYKLSDAHTCLYQRDVLRNVHNIKLRASAKSGGMVFVRGYHTILEHAASRVCIYILLMYHTYFLLLKYEIIVLFCEIYSYLIHYQFN